MTCHLFWEQQQAARVSRPSLDYFHGGSESQVYGPAACAPVVTNSGAARGTPCAQQWIMSQAEHGWKDWPKVTVCLLLLLLCLLYHSACMFLWEN